VALGYSQVPGVNFSENYAPIVNNVTMRIMMVLMTTNEWLGEIIDVETAFLYGNLEEEIYMTIPKGFEEFLNQDLKNKCLILKKSIYGLVQAARAWWKKFTHSLQSIGFKKCASDNCLMMRINKIGIVILCIYVDDVCCIGDKNAIEQSIVDIERLYKIKRVGKMLEFVGVNINIVNDDLFFTQTDTLKRLERKFSDEIKKLKCYDTPAGINETVICPEKDKELLNQEGQEKYRSGVGILLWLMKHSRPDIANAIREARKVMDGATKTHQKYLL
jgi:Reverse transcriptase (RNA-dependent DNA polymerase)